jgi:hypothetical protein
MKVRHAIIGIYLVIVAAAICYGYFNNTDGWGGIGGVIFTLPGILVPGMIWGDGPFGIGVGNFDYLVLVAIGAVLNCFGIWLLCEVVRRLYLKIRNL